MIIYSQGLNKALGRMLSAPEVRWVLVGPPGTGRTTLAQAYATASGGFVAAEDEDVSRAADPVVKVAQYPLPGFAPVRVPLRRKTEEVRLALVAVPSHVLRTFYGLKYVSPVLADWAAPLSAGSVDTALRLLHARQHDFFSFTTLVSAVNGADLPSYQRAIKNLSEDAPAAHRVNHLLAAWMLSELGKIKMIDQDRHLPYPQKMLLSSHATLTTPTVSPPVAKTSAALWPLYMHQAGM